MLLTSYSSFLPPLLLYIPEKAAPFPPPPPMAVQARHFNPLIRRPLLKRGSGGGVTSFCNTTVDSIAISVQRMAPPTDCCVLPLHHSFWSPPCSVKTAAAEGESRLSSNSVQTPGNTSKRSREVSTILDDDIYLHIQEQQQLEIDHLLSQHEENIRTEIMGGQRWDPELFIDAVEDAMAVGMEEVEMLRRMNYALQERIKCLNVENDAWREIASRKEVEMNRLRRSLDEVAEKRVSVVDDCVSSSEEGPSRKRVKEEMVVLGMCRRCGGKASTVLVLPCKHLCLCYLCGSTERRCPVCGMNMNVSVHVNLC